MPEAAIPDWVADTPDEPDYILTMFEGGGASEQEVELTRDEFIALKAHLAAMRGYSLGDLKTEVVALSKEMEAAAPSRLGTQYEQIAGMLAVAREMYRRCPEIVVGCNVNEAALIALEDETDWPEE